MPEKRILLTNESINKETSPIVKINSKDLQNEKVSLIVDTGAELNLIKEGHLRSNVFINTENHYQIFGITKEGMTTRGMVELTIEGKPCPFQVVSDEFSINQDGMLGMPFSKGAVVDLKENIET